MADLIAFDRLYDCIYLAADWQYWVPDVHFKRCLRIRDRGVLAGRHNVGLFAISPALRGGLYAGVPNVGSVLNIIEVCRFLRLPSWRTILISSSMICRLQHLSGTYLP